jgi:hypothetical protein
MDDDEEKPSPYDDVLALIGRAAAAIDSADAMRFAQAAQNAAQALACIKALQAGDSGQVGRSTV